MTVRVRFSPAPTGYLHVGSARSALFNWLYAKHTDGTMILRIEDTDTDRSTPELIASIHDSLTWLGITWDEEYRQSDRFDQYLEAVEKLKASGHAYYCECSQEEAQQRAKDRGGPPGYDGYCRDRGIEPGEGVVVRFRTPDEGVTGWTDLIRGDVEFENKNLEDFVIVRSNGVPMFLVANAYDDLDMDITHVIRGEDLINTVPKVLLLREAMGATSHPIYAHLPLIVNEKRQKLSKRRDDVSVDDYKERGYLPEAMTNYLATLGWGPEDGVEIRPMSEIIEQFEVEDVVKSPAFFDVKKLEHFNAEYVQAMDPALFIEQASPHIADSDSEVFGELATVVQERVKFLHEAPDLVSWIKGDMAEPVEKDWRKVMGKDGVKEVLETVLGRIDETDWTPAGIEKLVFGVGEELETKTQLPVRLAITGSRFGLPLFEPMALMDKEVVKKRLEMALSKLPES